MFGPKILRVLRGQGDKWDHRSRARGITASFCINGGGLMPDEGVDLYQENEELKVIKKSDLFSVLNEIKFVHTCWSAIEWKKKKRKENSFSHFFFSFLYLFAFIPPIIIDSSLSNYFTVGNDGKKKI